MLYEVITILNLKLEIVLFSFRPHLDFFGFDASRLFLGFGSTLTRLILIFAVIHNTANRRNSYNFV